MASRHLVTRGNSFQFVCRVPRDISHHFPIGTIWKPLKAKKLKEARVLADELECRTQKLFFTLRTGMLDPDLEKQMVNLYLKKGIDALARKAEGRPPLQGKQTASQQVFDAIDSIFDMPSAAQTPEELKAAQVELKAKLAETTKRHIVTRRLFSVEEDVTGIERELKGTYGAKLNEEDKRALSLKLMNSNRILLETETAILSGDWSPLETLRERVDRDLAGGYCDFKTVIENYQPYYLATSPNIKRGSKDDMYVECRVLLEIIGNIGITSVNTLETITKLKHALLKYPKNKQQRYGERSIHSIIRSEKGYETISLKTANNYIKRLKLIIDFANKDKKLNASNVAIGELFKISAIAEEERAAYSSDDISRLIDAICNERLWQYGTPKPERFWLILIALFHGLRLGNIVALTKKDICQTDKGTWIFHLRTGKTESTIRPVAICDSLLLLGFLEWVEKLPRNNLFQDTSASFSKWYNRNEKRADGYEIKGFESQFITTDPKKCLYSIRHNFAGNVFDLTEDYKITADMMGHSTGKSVTARYTKLTRAETLKEIHEKMQLEHIDLDKLESRAIELFFSKPELPVSDGLRTGA